MGNRPGSNTKQFVAIVVNIPLSQFFTFLIGLLPLALEWLLPFVREPSVARLSPVQSANVGVYSWYLLVFTVRCISAQSSILIAGFVGIMVHQVSTMLVYSCAISGAYMGG